MGMSWERTSTSVWMLMNVSAPLVTTLATTLPAPTTAPVLMDIGPDQSMYSTVMIILFIVKVCVVQLAYSKQVLCIVSI